MQEDADFLVKLNMPRQGRIHKIGGIYHVIIRGIERQKIYQDSADRKEFIRRLAQGLAKTKSQCYAWALLSNHAHLLLSPQEKPISELMRSVLTGYAGYFNRRHKRVGHVFQNRYKSIMCQKENYLQELVRYIHLNPLRGGIVKDLGELNQHQWTGHSAIMGRYKREWQNCTEILRYFGKKRGRAMEKYLEYIQAGMEAGHQERYEGGGLKRSAGGWETIKGLKKAREYWSSDERILGESDFVEEVMKTAEEKLSRQEEIAKLGWTLEEAAKEICRQLGVKLEAIKKKWRINKAKEAKALIAYVGRQELGKSRKEIAEYLDISQSGVNYLIEKGEELNCEKRVNLLFNQRPPMGVAVPKKVCYTINLKP